MNRLPYCAALLALAVSAAPRSSDAQEIQAEANSYRRAEAGWLEREVYRSPADGKVAVEFVDVLVGAGRIARFKEAPAGALLDVKAGVAILSLDKKRQRVSPGEVIRIDHGQMLAIDNRTGERAFVARLMRIAAPR